MKIIWNRLSKDIPTEQAAYQPGRRTTVHVWAVKMITEKAIISSNYKIYLILLDMSKAFDTVNRKILFDHLEETLAPDELYIMSRLTNNTEIQVKVVKNMEIDSKALLVSCKATASRLCCSFTI